MFIISTCCEEEEGDEEWLGFVKTIKTFIKTQNINTIGKIIGGMAAEIENGLKKSNTDIDERVYEVKHEVLDT